METLIRAYAYQAMYEYELAMPRRSGSSADRSMRRDGGAYWGSVRKPAIAAHFKVFYSYYSKRKVE